MLEHSEERVTPEFMDPLNPMLLEHLARYHFSMLYAKGRVLDFACGSGYGTQLVAKLNKQNLNEIIGVDLNEDAITYARARYHHPLASYQVADVTDTTLPEQLGTFDTILSFETLEHIHDEAAFMSNLYRLLKPGGTLVMSTPYGEGRGIPCGQPFHVHQLTREEFRDLFTSYKSVTIYNQKGVLIEPPREGIHYPLGIAVCVK